MKAQILKIAGVKNEKEFYKKFPTEEAFLKKHGKELKKAQNGYQSTVIPTADDYEQGMNAPMTIEQAARQAKDEQKANYDRMVSYANQFGVMQDNPDVNPSAAIKAPKTSKGIDWKGGGNALLSNSGDIVAGIQMVKASQEKTKQLLQGKELTSLGLKAASLKDTNKRYNLNNRPENQRFAADQLGSTYGIGTNYLGQAADGAMIGGNPSEIANYYTHGNTIYSDLGYEPLNDSSELKQFQMGGMFGGQDMSSQTGNLGSAVGSWIGGGGFEATPEGKLGADIGNTVGSFIPIPGAKEALSFVGGAIGGGVGGAAAKERRSLQQQSSNDMANMAFLNSSNNPTLGSARKDGGPVNGGWVSNDWMPQVITTFGEHKMSDLLKPPHDADMLRAGGHLKEYTPPSARAMYTDRYQDGGRTAYDGDVQVGSNGGLKPLANNLYEITGDRHSAPSGGVVLSNGQNSRVMAEGTETIRKDIAADGSTDGSLSVIGNRKANDYLKQFVDSDIYKVNKGTTMKNISKDLGKIVTKSNQKADKAMQMINDLDVRDGIDKITLKSLELQAKGNQQKSQIADGQIDALVAYQNATGDMADQLGIEINAFDKGKIVPLTEKEKKAAFGAKLETAQKGKKLKYDPEFENFIDQAMMLEQANSLQAGDYRGGGSYFGTNNPALTSPEKAKEYYYKNYWSKVKDLPKGLRTRALQMAINTGDPYGELMVAAGKMSVADRAATKGQRKDKAITGNKDWEKNKAAILKAYEEDPDTLLAQLDAEQDRYYNSIIANNPSDINSDTRKEFFDDYVGLAKYAAAPYVAASGPRDYDYSRMFGRRFSMADKKQKEAEFKKNDPVGYNKVLNDINRQFVAERRMVEGDVPYPTEFVYTPLDVPAPTATTAASASTPVTSSASATKELWQIPKKERAALAKANGIKNYTGTKAQNMKLLDIINKPTPIMAPVTNVSTPSGIVDDSGYIPSDQQIDSRQALMPEAYGSFDMDTDEQTMAQPPAETIVENFGAKSDPRNQKKKGNTDWMNTGLATLNSLIPFYNQGAQRPLNPDQLIPEYMALAMNQLEPVQAQLYNPMLQAQPYRVSLQDQRNEVIAQQRAAERMAYGNPAAAAMIASQASNALNKINAEEFRANQSETMRAAEANRAQMNEAQRVNLGILDQQYARQSEAQSKTKTQALEVAKSFAQKNAEQRKINNREAILRNMYPGFSFTKSGVAYKNPLYTAMFNVPDVGTGAESKEDITSPTNLFKNEETTKSKTTKRNGGIVKAIKNL